MLQSIPHLKRTELSYSSLICKKEFDIEKNINDNMKTICPFCKSGNTERLISLNNFILKGQGWYKTEYKNK